MLRFNGCLHIESVALLAIIFIRLTDVFFDSYPKASICLQLVFGFWPTKIEYRTKEG